jgi:acyl-homoserine-lactone acylase
MFFRLDESFILFFSMKNFIFLLLLSTSFANAQVNPQNIRIARDSFGVPHIFAPTDQEVAYGLAWAHAEDDFPTLQLMILSGKAKLASALGKKGAQADYVVNLLRCRQLVEDQWSLLSPDFIKLVNGYVQGINAYAKAHPKEIKYKNAFPVNDREYLTASIFSLSIFCGVEKTLPKILGGKVETIPGFSSEGSNAFAFHPSKTNTGEAFLAINAHQPVEGPVAFYEAHLQSEEKITHCMNILI